jgi:DNA repair exonuclease SbcCD nuclease subunit
MRTLLLTDTHFGAKKNSEIFLEYFAKCFQETILPKIREYNPDKIIHLGDVFDERKSINVNTLSFVYKNIFDHLRDYPLDIIVGNHDCAFRNTNDVNSPSLLLEDYDNIRVFSETTEVDGILYIPWINSSNEKESKERIWTSECNLAMGHLELNGYVMHSGVLCESGHNPDILHKFDMVLSGHFHTKNSKDNIHYLGSPWDILFNDMSLVKCFHTLDTETLELDSFENPHKIYTRIFYNDFEREKFEDVYPNEETLQSIQNTFLRVFVTNKNNPVWYDRFRDMIYEAGAASVLFDELDDTTGEELKKMTSAQIEKYIKQDTLSIIRNSVSEYEQLFPDKEKQKKAENILTDMYMRALQL